MMASSRWTMYC